MKILKPQISRGQWWASGLEVGVGPVMMIKIANYIGGADHAEATINAKAVAAMPDMMDALAELALEVKNVRFQLSAQGHRLPNETSNMLSAAELRAEKALKYAGCQYV
jgi:hypothetical protein